MTIEKKTKISMDKKYRYRNGKPARILCVDTGDDYHPVISLSPDSLIVSHNSYGALNTLFESIYDLIEIKEEVMIDFWINVYPNGMYQTFPNREEAEKNAADHRVACIKINKKVTHGEGIDTEE